MKVIRLLCVKRFCQHVLPSVRLLHVGKHQGKLATSSKLKNKSAEEDNHIKKIPLVVCKNESLNHYKGQSYSKFDVVPLASQGWLHRKSKGDYFYIKNYGEAPKFDHLDDSKSFQSLGIPEEIIDVLNKNGITMPTHIQNDGIPYLLKGHNTLLSAETGSGKTLAYVVPLIKQICEYRNLISREKMNSPFCIVITPSRELAHQIGECVQLFSELGINVDVITGGRTKKMIMSPSFKEVDILVASIGALSKLITTGIYRTNHVKHIVLDEADTLLDDSFNPKVLYLLGRFSFLPTSLTKKSEENPCIQLCLASATIPTSVDELLGPVLPVETLRRVTSKNLHCIQPHVPQHFMRVGRSQKPAALLNIANVSFHKKEPFLIFSNKSSTCDWIDFFLNENGIKCYRLNGDMQYITRIGKFRQFQQGDVNVLSCTDMGSRGLDTVRVKHVLNYDFPVYMADYIHRCGRTGRIGSPQHCHITHFISGELEVELVKKIELAVRKGEPLPNVNANIRRIIEHKYSKHNEM